MKTKQLISEVQSFGEDNEFYPTTDEIIQAMHRDMIMKINDGYSLLECGAGNGKVITSLQSLGENHTPKYGSATKPTKCYAIEKSPILLSSLPKDIIVVGTDFWSNTLIDKKVDVLFCNPPYKEYERWVERIIMEGYAKYVYLVIPARWTDNPLIQGALESRKAEAKVVGSFDFLQSEDRKARAKVELIRIDLGTLSSRSSEPFDLWFDTFFVKPAQEANKTSDSAKTDNHDTAKDELIKSDGLIETLEKYYQEDLANLTDNFQKIIGLDPELLGELGVSLDGLKESLKLKIEHLKDRYWRELFNNLNKITSRLTTDSRKTITEKLFENTHVDFSVSNAYAVLEWCIKNANSYYDSQLVDVFTQMIDKANIHNFKSNKRVFSDSDWRYNRYDFRRSLSHIKLDYRIVIADIGGLALNWLDHHVEGLSERTNNFVNDLVTLANNLGFTCEQRAEHFDWAKPGAKEFMFKSLKTDKQEVLMAVRAYKNRNIHIKFNQAFIFALNVEMARLKSWINSAKEAAFEMDIPLDEAEFYFKSNFVIEAKNMNTLLPGPVSDTPDSGESVVDDDNGQYLIAV